MKQSLRLLQFLLVWLTLATGVGAWSQELDAALREQIVMVPKSSAIFSLELETTIFRPPGEGPFPVVVINHGKAFGDTRFQARYRPTGAARFFLQRGYAVVVPMRQGFSKSGGSYVGGGCNVASNGTVQAEDVKAVLDYVTTQPWADKTQILVVGQSHGGWTSLAFATFNYPGVKGVVNFAGGLRQDNCAGWEGGLARASAAYGKATSLASLWFYGDNDSYFSPSTFLAMHAAYVAAGASAELVEFGLFGSDSHSLFGARAGEPIWQPRVETFMRTQGLPVAVVFPALGVASRLPVPPRTDFATADAFEKVPYLKETGRTGYKTFLTKQLPRAFAISPSGAWGWAEMGDDPLARALANCNKNTAKPCRLYAVDADVVWIKE